MSTKDAKGKHRDKIGLDHNYAVMEKMRNPRARELFKAKPYGMGVVKNETKEKASDKG